jgi:ERCC4-type nuclease
LISDPTILVDDREKTPLIFPAHLTVHNPTVPWAPSSRIIRLHTAPARLETGDYVLASHPNRGCVERKAHLSELAGNLFDERRYRLFTAELERLRDLFSHPLLLLEGSPTRPFKTRSCMRITSSIKGSNIFRKIHLIDSDNHFC